MEKKEFLMRWMLAARGTGKVCFVEEELKEAERCYMLIDNICDGEEMSLTRKALANAKCKVLDRMAEDMLDMPRNHKTRLMGAVRYLTGKKDVTVQDVVNLSYNQIYGCRNVGGQTMWRLQEALYKLGISWDA